MNRFASDTPAINSSAFSHAQPGGRSARQRDADGIFSSFVDVHAPAADVPPKPKPPAAPARSSDERPAPPRSKPAPASSRDDNPSADANGPSASGVKRDGRETAPAGDSKTADLQQTDAAPAEQPAQDVALTTDGTLPASTAAQDSVPQAVAVLQAVPVPQPVVVPAVPIVPVVAVVGDVSAPAQVVAPPPEAATTGSSTPATDTQTKVAGSTPAAAEPGVTAAPQTPLASETAAPSATAGSIKPSLAKKDQPLAAESEVQSGVEANVRSGVKAAVPAGTQPQPGDESAGIIPTKMGDAGAQPVLSAAGAAKLEKPEAEAAVPKVHAILPGVPDPTLQSAPGLPQPAFAAHLGQTAAQTAAAAPAPSSVTVPVADVAVTIAAQAQAGSSRFEIRLDPPELGRIEVRLHVQHDGRTTSHLIVERPDTLDLLRRDAPTLERALEQAGLKTSENSLQFSLRDQPFSQQDRQQAQQQFTNRPFAQDDAPAAIAAISRQSLLASLRGGLDIQV